MTWSREYPKEPGWYWWRKNKHNPSRILELEAFGTTKVLCERHYGAALQEWGGEWGPRIPEPTEINAAANRTAILLKTLLDIDECIYGCDAICKHEIRSAIAAAREAMKGVEE